MTYLENLSRQNLRNDVMPWEFKPTTPIPNEVRKDKMLRTAWITNPQTHHQVYTFWKGLNSSVRISNPGPDESGNPAHSISALVADFDVPTTEALVMEWVTKMTWKPNKVERTLSENWRFIWLFEEPLLLPSHEFAKHFLRVFPTIAFDPASLLPAFDRGAWEAPDRLFTNSCDWRHIHDNPIPADVTRGWLVLASNSFKWTEKEFGLEIPLDVVQPELQKLFPRFNGEWQAEFREGAQGPSFWIDGSTSPKSAIVRDRGMQTFAAHATRGFYTWADLLGSGFCKRYEAEAIGKAVKDIFHDGKHYHRRQPDGGWKGYEKADTVNHLIAARSLSPRSGSGVSDIQKAIEYIHSYQSIVGAAPFIFRPSGLIYDGDQPLLNTSNLKVMSPIAGKGTWGPDGNFPWVSFWLDNFFSSPEQLPYFKAWHSHFYKGGFSLRPCSGQALFVIGEVGVGKTLLGQELIGRTMGGSVDAQRYLMGDDKFGSQVFEKPVWNVDDGSVAADPRKHKLFTEIVKRVVANREHEYHKKFGVPSRVGWLGRPVITGNADEESVRIIPNLGQSILDKLMIFRTVPKSSVKFPTAPEIKTIFDRELPAYCAYLRDYQIPDQLIGDSRFGIKCYHEPSLVRSSIQSSENAGFGEILADWKKEHFKLRGPQEMFWEGTAFQLLKSMVLDPGAEKFVQKLSVEAVGRHLAGLKSKGARIEVNDEGNTRHWKIFRDDSGSQSSTKKG